MGQSKHYRFIMHIIQHIFICQNLQTGREFLVRLPESHDDRKERKKRQLIGHISSLQLETEEELPWSLDGEYVPGAAQIEIETLPQALELVL